MTPLIGELCLFDNYFVSFERSVTYTIPYTSFAISLAGAEPVCFSSASDAIDFVLNPLQMMSAIQECKNRFSRWSPTNKQRTVLVVAGCC